MSKKKKLKEFLVETSITGRATALVMAEDEQDARDRFWSELYSENILEWAFDEIKHVEENK